MANKWRALVWAWIVTNEPMIRRDQRLIRPIINKNTWINLRSSKSWQRIDSNWQTDLTQLLPDLQTERDKRLHSQEREEFDIDDWSKFRVRYTNDKYWTPIYQVDTYFNMEWTNLPSWRWSDLWGYLSEYYAEWNNSDIYRNSRLKSKYTSKDNLIKAGTLRWFWPKDSPYNMPYNQKI